MTNFFIGILLSLVALGADQAALGMTWGWRVLFRNAFSSHVHVSDEWGAVDFTRTWAGARDAIPAPDHGEIGITRPSGGHRSYNYRDRFSGRSLALFIVIAQVQQIVRFRLIC